MTWVAVAIGGSALIAGGATAFSASQTAGSLDAQTDVAQQQAELAQQLADESSPLRRALLAQYGDFINNGALPASLTGDPSEQANLYGLDTFMAGGDLPAAVDMRDTTAANRDVLEAQFGRARDATIAQAPGMGGYLAAGLQNLEGQRALGVTGITSAANREENALRQQLYGVGLDLSQQQANRRQLLRQQLFGQAGGAGFGQLGAALAGLGGASTNLGNAASTSLRGTAALGDVAGDAAGLGFFGLMRRNATPATPAAAASTSTWDPVWGMQ